MVIFHSYVSLPEGNLISIHFLLPLILILKPV